jgi:hypothetical protein
MLERADAVLRHVTDRTHRAYVEAGADPIQVGVPSLRDAIAAPPEYLDDYLDFVQRLRVNPLVARDLLQTAELLCFDALVGGSSWRAPAFARLLTAEHQGLLLVAIRCLRSIAGEQIAAALDPLAGFFATVAPATVPDRRSSPQSAASAPIHGGPGDDQPGAPEQPTLI